MFYCSKLSLNALASLGPMLESGLNESSMFSRFCQLLSDIASDWSSGLVVKIAVKIVVKIVVTASSSASSVTIFDIFYDNPEISFENV